MGSHALDPEFVKKVDHDPMFYVRETSQLKTFDAKLATADTEVMQVWGFCVTT